MKKIRDKSSEIEEYIKVNIRVRPLNTKEIFKGEKDLWEINSGT